VIEGIADYRFDAELGAGNHGRFFRATTPARLNVDAPHVAVKVLERRATDSDFKRVANELRIFAAVTSEHLVEVFDAGYDDGLLFYAMAYYPDGSLERPARPLSPEAVAGAIADAARGAHELHEVGVVHRDIKPANVLLDGDRGRLSDLGLARLMSPGMTTTGIGPVGSLEFMEPEVIWGDPGSRMSDVWSLGVTLHHALTGQGLYGEIPNDSVLEAFTHVLRSRPEISATLPDGYRPIVERCLADARAERFATAAQLANAVEAVLRPEPEGDEE